MVDNSITYHIVGGGISGLSCAWFLKKKKNIKVIVYEAKNILGGRAFSYDDDKLKCKLDNAVHTIIGANKFMSSFVKKEEWEYTKYFVDSEFISIDTSILKNKNILFKSFCNTAYSDIAEKIKNNILRMLFPFTKNKRKVWFSKQDISQRIINVLSCKTDEIKLNSKLKNIKTKEGKVILLDFGNYKVDVKENDKIILALDNHDCANFISVNRLEYSQIINITYFTSQTIFLPKGASFIAQKNGLADFVFVNNGTITAVISDYKNNIEHENLAIKIWKEIDALRGVDSAFMPEYRISHYQKATIKQDKTNNLLRPKNALTEFLNLFIAGDWTMKNYPCCMEVAVKSAKRAVKTSLKLNKN